MLPATEQPIITTFKERQALFASQHLADIFNEQKYEDIIQKPEKFTDYLFPPFNCSLYSGKTDFSKSHTLFEEKIPKERGKNKILAPNNNILDHSKCKYTWIRLSDFYGPDEISILKLPSDFDKDKDVLCEDVVQGDLGDCYFLSAISALAEYPNRIEKLIPQINFNDKGVFQVKVFYNGSPLTIVIDDYFIFLEKEGFVPQPAFAGFNPNTRNIWPMILEKAWAKINLTYEDIISGNSADAFEFLCPAPIDTYYHEYNEDTLYDEIVKADDNNYIICSDITVTENTNLGFLSQMGLLTNHAYTVIDKHELKDPNGNSIRLLKIRNPWGTNEWTGDWSDKSDKWTAEYKKEVNFHEEDDGTYWMAYEDFTKFYTNTHICRIHDDYHLASNKYLFDPESQFNLVQIDIPSDTKGFFIVNMKNKRIFRNIKGLDNFENRFCSVAVLRRDKEKLIYIGSTSGRDNRLYVQCENMVKGSYIIAVSFPQKAKQLNIKFEDFEKTDPNTLIGLAYRIGVYSPIPDPQISAVPKEGYKVLSDFMKELIYQMACQNPCKYYFEQEGESESWRAISFEKNAGALGYLFYENNSEGFIHEWVKFTQLENVNIIPLLNKGEFKKINLAEQDDDPYTRSAVEYLMNQDTDELQSSCRVLTSFTENQKVDEKHPVEIMVDVAPQSTCFILLEKCEDDAAINLTSQIQFSYPPYVLLSGRFPMKKTKLKYNNAEVAIHEHTLEHNTGVLFQYKNKTNDLKAIIHVMFPEMDNLTLDKFDFIEEEKEIDATTPSNEIVISLEPGMSKFFNLTAINLFISFTYSCQVDYKIHQTSRPVMADK